MAIFNSYVKLPERKHDSPFESMWHMFKARLKPTLTDGGDQQCRAETVNIFDLQGFFFHRHMRGSRACHACGLQYQPHTYRWCFIRKIRKSTAEIWANELYSFTWLPGFHKHPIALRNRCP
jgi:hypothetical protein